MYVPKGHRIKTPYFARFEIWKRKPNVALCDAELEERLHFAKYNDPAGQS
jgi:hypothetical protein